MLVELILALWPHSKHNSYTVSCSYCNRTLILTGSQVILRHIRNGVELNPIDLNLHFDFNYQQINYIPRVQVLPVSGYV